MAIPIPLPGTLAGTTKPILSTDPCIVLTPKCPEEEIYGWGDSFDSRTSPMMAKTFEMIEMVEQSFNLDRNRYYINGTSMGGIGTFGVIQKHPNMFAASYVLCGYVNVEIAPIIAGIPMWIFHGTDDSVVPVQSVRELFKEVKELGGTQIRYTEYEGVGHNVWDYTGNETTLSTWLLAQRKGYVSGIPNNVSGFSGEITTDNFVRLHWQVPVEEEQESDNRIWFVKVFKNDELITEVYNNQNSYIDSSIVVGDNYGYSVVAVNYYFKESEPSPDFLVTVDN